MQATGLNKKEFDELEKNSHIHNKPVEDDQNYPECQCILTTLLTISGLETPKL